MKQVKIDTAFQRRMIKNVAFFGDAQVGVNDIVYKDAFEIAKSLAEEGYVIVNGGGPGVMNASTQGAEAGRGETLSVTFDTNEAPGFEGKYLGNITDKEIKTTNYIERMFKLIQHADIFIIFKGGTGTVSEFGTAWVLAKLYYGHHKPFILYGKFWHKIVKVLKNNLNIDKQELSVFEVVDKPENVLPAVEKLQRELSWGKR